MVAKLRSSCGGVLNSPDLVRYVIRNQQRAVLRNVGRHRTSPRRTGISAVENPSRHEVFQRAGGFSIFEGHEQNTIAGKFGAVPGSVQTDERASAEALRNVVSG